MGGDEFVALLLGLSCNPPQAEMHASSLAEQLIDAVSAPYYYGDQVLHLGASVGVTASPARIVTRVEITAVQDSEDEYRDESDESKSSCLAVIGVSHKPVSHGSMLGE